MIHEKSSGPNRIVFIVFLIPHASLKCAHVASDEGKFQLWKCEKARKESDEVELLPELK
jgi:hypothetical protein